MDDRLRAFIERHPDAAMITYRPDGTAHMARIELGVVDGRIQSSGSRVTGPRLGTSAATPVARSSSSVPIPTGSAWRRR